MSAGYFAAQNQSSASAASAVAVTPSDSVLISPPPRALYIGTTGNLKVTMLDGTVVTFNTVPVGIFPISVTLVWSTGTTASNIVALY